MASPEVRITIRQKSESVDGELKYPLRIKAIDGKFATFTVQHTAPAAPSRFGSKRPVEVMKSTTPNRSEFSYSVPKDCEVDITLGGDIGMFHVEHASEDINDAERIRVERITTVKISGKTIANGGLFGDTVEAAGSVEMLIHCDATTLARLDTANRYIDNLSRQVEYLARKETEKQEDIATNSDLALAAEKKIDHLKRQIADLEHTIADCNKDAPLFEAELLETQINLSTARGKLDTARSDFRHYNLANLDYDREQVRRQMRESKFCSIM